MKAIEVELEVLEKTINDLAQNQQPYPNETSKNTHKYEKAMNKLLTIMQKRYSRLHNKIAPTAGEA